MPNLAEISNTTKALLGVGVLMFIDLLFNWQEVCVSFAGVEQCGGRSGWAGWGTLVGILLIGLLIWEGLTLAGMHKNLNLPVAAGMISAALTVAILVFTVIKFLADNEFRKWPAWVGLVLAIVLVVLGWRKYVEAGGMEGMTSAPAQQPPPPPPAEPPAAPPPTPPA
jgi:hypothetical protein